MSEFNSGLPRSSPLSFAIAVIDRPPIATVGDAADFFAALDEQRRQQAHWRLAMRMLDVALREPSYLKAATMWLQTALIMEGLVVQIQS
jgi:hypothetical protein